MRKLSYLLGGLLVVFAVSVLVPKSYAAEEAKKEAKLEGVVNINTATVKQLQILPGIGKKTAQAIIKYREEKGNFKAIEEIKNVKGIGDKIFDKIKDNLVLEGDTTAKKPGKEPEKKLEQEPEKKLEGE